MFRFHLLKRISRGHSIEPQEVFLDNLAKKKEAELGISEKKFEVPLSKKILQGFLIFVIVLVLLLFGKTFQFQVLENKSFLAKAQQNKFFIQSIQAARGVIYDSQGKQLVFNKPSFDLILDKRNLPESDLAKEKILKEVSKIIEKNPEEIKSKIDQEENQRVLISQNLSYQKLILLETRLSEFPGFQIEQNPIREYPDGENFSHLIGYTGRATGFDYVGKDGLESSYEEVLRKNPGELRFERDVYGNIIAKEIISLPGPGHSLVLWLDSELQNKIKEVLEKILMKTGSKKAAAVALNPQSGGVLSLISLPSFDNNLFSKGADIQALKNLLSDPQEALFDRAISGLYPTGSIIKPLVAAAALEEKIITPEKKIDDTLGFIEIPHRYDPEITYRFRDWRAHGWTDLKKAIAESCNVYFYIIGGGYEEQEGLGPSKIKKYLELFNWASKTGIDLPSESLGLIPSPDWKKEKKNENWWDGDTYNLAIGQGDILVTPLQVATAFVAVANGGTLFKPKLVKQIIDSEKNIIEELSSEILRENFVDQKNLQIVREGMRQAVTGENSPHASSVILNSLPVSAAAKTGTAQTPRPDYYHNWITVFAPYQNPEIVLTIMIEDVKEVQAAALPAAKEILEWYFSK